MYKLSIVISLSDNGTHLEKCLNSIKKQTLKDIEILVIANHPNLSIKNNRINVFKSISQALGKINSQYIIIIDETEYLQRDACDLLYSKSKYEDLDLLYAPIIDENFERNQLSHFEETSQIISPFNFAQFCKRDIFDSIKLEDNLFYEIHQKSKRIDFINEKIYFRTNLKPKNVEKYTKEFLNFFPNETNTLFNILLKYIINYPFTLKKSIYEIMKLYFKDNDINKKNQEIYNLILTKDNLIDFLTEYKLNTVDYKIYKNPLDSKDNYKISVIIPIFNKEKLIHRTLMSIENQSFGIENIEVLMINDASTDNTKNVINQYVDKYHNFNAIHLKNGTGSAGIPRNLGLKLATADYVMFIDHDDFLEIDALEKLYNKITEHNCDLVYGTYSIINSEESIKFIYPNEKHGFFKNLDDNKRSITIPPSIWTKLFKKEFLEKNKILFPTILGEDAIFMAKSLKCANGVYYLWNDVICYYNLNENSYSTNLSCRYFVEGFESEKYLYNLFSEWDEPKYYKIRGQGILDFYLNRLLTSNLSDEELKKLFPLIYEFCDRLNKLNVNPKLEKNNVAFEYVINNDLKNFLKLKNYKPKKIQLLANKILNKINKN